MIGYADVSVCSSRAHNASNRSAAILVDLETDILCCAVGEDVEPRAGLDYLLSDCSGVLVIGFEI